MSEPLDLQLTNRMDSIPAALEAVEGHLSAAGCGEAVRFDISLALDEVLANIVGHAFDAQGNATISLRISVAPDAVHAEVSDAGRAFDPLGQQEPDLDADLDAREIGGLGIHFLRETMTDLRYERSDGLNRLSMTRKR